VRRRTENQVFFLCIRVAQGIANRIFGLGMYAAVNGLGYAGTGGPFFHLPGGKVTLVLHEIG
jgi:hypothetical protein